MESRGSARVSSRAAAAAGWRRDLVSGSRCRQHDTFACKLFQVLVRIGDFATPWTAMSRVHLLSCETRPSFGNTSSFRDLHFESRKLLPHGFVMRNLCTGMRWESGGRSLMAKPRKLLDYALSTGPRELLVFTDSDVVFNAKLDSHELLRRFESARNGSKLLFQAEPMCWAPAGNLLHCSREILQAYAGRPSAKVPSRCPRFLNSGAFAGHAADLVPVLRLWTKPERWVRTTRNGFCDQSVIMSMWLQGNASVQLDYHETIFATSAVAKGCIGRRCHQCGLPVPSEDDKDHGSCAFDSDFVWTVREGGLQRTQVHADRCGTWGQPFAIHFNGPTNTIRACT